MICWDGRTLAADKRCCVGGLVRTVTKIHRVGGLLVGGSGELSFILAVVEWVRGGRLAEKFPADQRNKDDYQPVLVIEADGTPSIYERTPHPIRYEDKCCAMGSGRDFAMAAMHLGKTAREAVEVACALDAGCGNGIDCIAHDGVGEQPEGLLQPNGPWAHLKRADNPFTRGEMSGSQWEAEQRRQEEYIRIVRGQEAMRHMAADLFGNRTPEEMRCKPWPGLHGFDDPR